MKHPALPLVASAAIIALLGAGCPKPTPSSQVNIPPVENEQGTPAAERGFGLLPALAAPGTLGSPEAISARPNPMFSATAVATPMAAGGVVMSEPAMKESTVAVDAMWQRVPEEMKPADLTYEVTASLPSWGEEDDVLRAKSSSLPTNGVSAIASAAGLPSQALGSNAQFTSMNFSWKDADGITWNFDSAGRNVSFWKETDVRIMADTAQGTTPPAPIMIEDSEAIRIANDFLTRKGFGNIPHANGEVEKPWGAVMPMTSMPCAEPLPYVKDGGDPAAVTTIAPVSIIANGTASGGGTSASVGTADAPVKMMIAPCYNQPQQVTVSFTAMMGSKAVSDFGGWPYRAMSVTIDLASKNVTGGNVWLIPGTDSSRYPLISADEAMTRLKAGGRNPIYPYYGEEVKEVKVVINSVKLSLVRYDAWADGRTTTYFLPALVGEGTISYGTTQDVYRTIVPLVADDAFGGADTGYGKPMPLMMNSTVPVAVPPPTPAVAPAPVK